MSLPEKPTGRVETYLASIAGQSVDLPPSPTGRIESYLDYIANNGGGVERGVAILANNKLVLPDGKWKLASNRTPAPVIEIENNIITLNGKLSTISNYYLYMKLSPPIAFAFVSGGNPDWKNESWEKIEVGKTYALDTFFLGGTKEGDSGDIVSSVKSSDDSTVLAHSQGVKILTKSAAYVRLYLVHNYTFNNFKIGVYIKENEMPNEWEYLNIDTEKKYYSATVNDNTQFISISPGRTPNNTQGMCIDDDYIYTCSITSNDGNNTFVGKYNKDTGELITSVTDYSLGHCNSMTMKDGVIYCIALDNVGTVHRISASDLHYIGSSEIDLSGIYADYTGIGAICYDTEKEEFVTLIRGNKKGYAFFDKNFNFKNILWTDNIEGTYGSFTVKNGFIYQNIHGSNAEFIAVITRNGTHVDDIALNLASGAEIEDIEFNEWSNYIYVNYIANSNSYVSRLIATDMKMVVTS